jgi:hypothetical protein
MAKAKRSIKDQKKIFVSPFKDYWGKNNYYLLFAGLGILILGYILMSEGPWDNSLSLSASPVILLIGYLIIIPLSIFFKIPRKFRKNIDVPGKG